MENRIPIDDLFRKTLSQGREQLNLGAWANMERMLDGKNPYSEEEKKKKRWLPILGIVAVVGTLITATLFSLNRDGKPASSAQTAAETAQTTPLASDLPAAASAETNNTSTSQTASSEAATSSGTEANPQVAIENSSNPNATSLTSASSQKNTVGSDSNPRNLANSKKLSSTYDNQTTSNHTDVLTTSQNSDQQIDSKRLDDSDSQVVTSRSSDGSGPQTPADANLNLDTIRQLELKMTTTTDKHGATVAMAVDTVKRSQRVVEKPKLKPEQSNPRLVKLTPEEELLASIKADNLSSAPPVRTTAPEVNSVTNPASNSKAAELSVAKSQENGSKDSKTNSGWFKSLQNTAREGFQKLSLLSMRILNANIPLYPGISMGVNASLFSKHNFGGFQAGFTNTIPLSEYFSMMTELKFFYRNNSGFTVTDANTTLRNQNLDTLTYASSNQNAYSYQMDSSVRIYNFKHVMSLEIPVYLQGHFGNFSVYGGLNLAYNFRLNVKQINRDFVINGLDIVDKNSNYTYPGTRGYQYSRDDFGSRFGIGYGLGASYSFNPNLYIDLRMTQNVWDNTQSNASRAISNGFFKIPSFQFALGYRFKKFDPKN